MKNMFCDEGISKFITVIYFVNSLKFFKFKFLEVFHMKITLPKTNEIKTQGSLINRPPIKEKRKKNLNIFQN